MLLRENAEELEKLKALVGSEGAASSDAPAASAEAVAALKAQQEELQGEISQLQAQSADNDCDAGDSDVLPASPSAAHGRLEQLRMELADVTKAIESGSEEEVKRTRLRERAAKAARAERQKLEDRLRSATATVSELQAAVQDANETAAKDLAAVFARVKEKEEELMAARGDLVAAREQVAMLKAQVDELSDSAVEAKASAAATVKAVNDETQRVMKDAAEAHAAELKDAVKAHAAELKELQGAHKAALKQARTNAASKANEEAAAAAAAAAEEKLHAAEQRAEQSEAALVEAQAELKAVRAELDDSKKRGDTLERKWTDARQAEAASSSRANNAESTAQSATQRAEEAEAKLAAAAEAKADLQAQLEELQGRVKASQSAQEAATAELQQARSDCEAAQAAASQAEEQLKAGLSARAALEATSAEQESTLADLERKLDRVSSDHKVAVKQHKQLKKDLGSELAKASGKVTALTAERDDLAARVEDAEARAATALVAPPASPASPRLLGSGPMSPAPGSPSTALPASLTSGARRPGTLQRSNSAAMPKRSNSVLGSFMSALSVPTASTSGSGLGGLAGLAPSGATAPGSTRPSTSVSSEPLTPSDPRTVKLLGQRLTNVLAENEHLRERLRMVETIVQDLSGELQSKKALLRGMTGASGKGPSFGGAGEPSPAALGLAHELGIDEASIALVEAASADENAVQTLSSLLFKHMAESSRLKQDLATLASAHAPSGEGET